MKEKLFKAKRVHKGKALDFYSDTVILPNGAKAVREYIKHPGAVAVLPFVDDKHILLVKQYRYPVKEITYEIPAGKTDKGEQPLKAVKRELTEETGYSAKNIKKLITFWPTAAFSDEVLHIYVAGGLKKAGNACPDFDEFINAEIFDFDKVFEMIKNGKIKDAKTIIALSYYKNVTCKA
jgi:ADP-ribose pyrophosphatase